MLSECLILKVFGVNSNLLQALFAKEGGFYQCPGLCEFPHDT